MHRSMIANMAPAYLLLVLICGTVMSLSDIAWAEDRNRESGHGPPPVASFLERLKTLRSKRSLGDVVHVPAALQPQESSLYIQPEDAGDVFRSHRSPVPHRRERRHLSPSIAMRGCHLGTCQTQNLANMLYHLGYNTGKDGSNKNTHDPQGYGRRRRALSSRMTPRRTVWVQHLLAT